MIKTTFTRLVEAVREQPMRLLPVFLGVFFVLLFTGYVAVSGRMSRQIASELPEDIPEEVAFVSVG